MQGQTASNGQKARGLKHWLAEFGVERTDTTPDKHTGLTNLRLLPVLWR